MKPFAFIQHFWRDRPLAFKIASITSLLVFFIVFALTVITIQREKKNFSDQLEKQAKLLLYPLTTVNEGLAGLRRSHLSEEVERVMREHPQLTHFKIYGPDGSVWVDGRRPEACPGQAEAGPCPPQVAPYSDEVDPASHIFLALDPELKIPYLDWQEDELIAGRAFGSGNEVFGAAEMDFSTQPLNNEIRDLTVLNVMLGAVAMGICILLAMLMARQLTNPISELTRTANRMAGGDLNTRFQGQSREEIGQLGRAFNDMAGAIEKRETELRNLASGLEQAVKERTQTLQQQNQYLAALHEVTFGLVENLDVNRLLEAIMVRAASLANAEHAFVNIVDHERGEMQRRVAQGRYREHLGTWTKPNQGLSGRVMASGQMMIEEDYQQFEARDPDYDWLRTSIYVPLRSESVILGVIGLGYDKIVPVNPNHVDILNQFAQLASLALKNAQLFSATQQELFVEEERRKAYLISPQGQAESIADSILKDPAQALITLHELTEKAEQEANAMVLAELPGAMERAGHTLLARLAEGYHFIYRSQSEPELLMVGLRQLRTGLELPEARSLQRADEAMTIYKLCHQAIDAGSIHGIAGLLPSLQALQAKTDFPWMLTGLASALKTLLPVAQSLHAYERVETTEDRRDYLASAIEALSHADRLAQTLHVAERSIVRRIIENWVTMVTGSMSDLQTRAQITCRLLSRHSWIGEMVAIALQLRNEGRGLALNLRVSLAESPDYKLVDDLMLMERLAPGEEAQVEFRVQPQVLAESNQFRARFEIFYDDPRGPNHAEHFADIVHLLAPESAFQFIPNPYVAGTPLETGSPLFFGREDLFSFIGENLSAAHRNNLVLIGQRRTGKSSLLKQLPLRLGESYVPVYLDGQSITLDPGLPAFFSNLAMEIGFALQDRGFAMASPDLQQFTDRPAHTFEHEYLRQVRAVIGNRHLVLLLDEFEELESAVKSGNLDASVFGFLRHLIQHEPRLSVIFCGTHRMEELATDYWSVLFNISLYKHVGFLEYDEAARLIQEPVAASGMRYDDLALDKMWRITAGHPYFLQLLCHSLVNQHNRAGRSYVTVSDVNAALDEILSAGEAHFIYLWNQSTRTERQVLTALSRMMTLTGHVRPVQVKDYLDERGILLDRHVIIETMQLLTLRDILAAQVDSQAMGTASAYGWRLGLLGLWVEKYKSLSLLQEEAQP